MDQPANKNTQKADVHKANPQGSAKPQTQNKSEVVTHDSLVVSPKRKIWAKAVFATAGAIAGGMLGATFRHNQFSTAGDMAFGTTPSNLQHGFAWRGIDEGTKAAEAITKAATTGAWSDRVRAYTQTVKELDNKGSFVSKIPGGSFTIVVTGVALGAILTAAALHHGIKKQEQFNDDLEARSNELTTDQKVDEIWRALVVNHKIDKQKAVVDAMGKLGSLGR